MRALGNAPTFAGLWLAAGCNALFGVEDPVVVGSDTDGGEAGGATMTATGGSVTTLPDPGPGGDAGAGGAAGAPFDRTGGDGGTGLTPEAGGGAGGTLEPGPEAGGTMSGGGGTQPATTGGVSGAAGSEDPAAGAAGTAGSSDCIEGESRCTDATTLETCEDRALRSAVCSNGCVQDRCAECSPASVECRPSDNAVRGCGSDGRFTDFQQCDGQTCLAGSGCSGDCEPGQVRCSTVNGDAEACDRGEWSLVTECATNEDLCVIEAGAAKCIPNTVRPLGPAQPLTNGSLRNVTPDVLHAYPAAVTDVKAFAVQLGLIGGGQPAHARLALYADDGNDYPGSLLGITDPLTVAATEPNAKNLLGPPLLLDPDERYWLAVLFANSGSPQLFCRINQQGGGYLAARAYDAGFPDTFPVGALADADAECNLFLRVRTQTP